MHSGLLRTLLICVLLASPSGACCPSSSDNSIQDKVLESSAEDDAETSTVLPDIEPTQAMAADSNILPDVKELESETTTAAAVEGDCGVSWYTRQDRIVGGTHADAREYPWQVRLKGFGWDAFCGGTVIDEHWVLTAAHCLEGVEPSDFVVVFGDINSTAIEEGEYTESPSSLYTHPAYNYVELDFDFGLIKFDGWNVKKACLPSRNCNDGSCQAGTLATVTGWGDLENSIVPTTLQEVTMQIISLDECSERWAIRDAVTKNMICTLPEVIDDNLSGACVGDSGGPMGQLIDGRFTICGSTSWGLMSGCGDNYYPDVFARVCEAIDWIKWIMTCEEELVNNNCPGMCSKPCPWNGICIAENSCFCLSGKSGEPC